MMPQHISKRIIGDRLALIEESLAAIRNLPLDNRTAFFADSRNVAATESYLRRSLEALLDIGRHILAKGFAIGVSEYKAIANQLGRTAVLESDDAALLRTLAGYRDRIVHFYHEITPDELYIICATQLSDVEHAADDFRRWVAAHPDMVNDQV